MKNNKFNSGVPAFIFLLLLIFPSFIYAQKPDFSGSWIYNESKSIIGEGHFRGAPTKIRVTQDDNTLISEKLMKGRDGTDRVTNELYTLDGKECENKGFQNNIKKSKAVWSSDEKSLTISSTMIFERNGETMEMKSTETWSISDDQNTFTLEVTASTPNGENKQTLVYDKAK
jgi:hypothetical protein